MWAGRVRTEGVRQMGHVPKMKRTLLNYSCYISYNYYAFLETTIESHETS
jgi:hypothetical protein